MNDAGIVIGLDLGTTNCKAVALGPDGQLLASASRAYPLHTPRAAWAEQQAGDLWDGAAAALSELASLVPLSQLAGLCLSGAMHSVLPVDSQNNPLAPAMTWADQRAAAQAEDLRQNPQANGLLGRVGCPLVYIYHPARLRWWFEDAPAIAGQAARFVALKDWILFQLTGVWATDWGLASTTGLLDIHRLAWDDEALALAGVNSGQLAPLVSPLQKVGGLTLEAAHLTGLPGGLPVVAGTSDGGTANLGSGAVLPGQAVITVGTSGAVRKIVDRPQVDLAGRTWCYVMAEDRWFSGGAINNGGLALQWMRSRFYAEFPGEEGFTRLMADAAEIDPGAGGVQVLPYFAGERSPYWNPAARAVITGLGLEHDRQHVARAALEGVAYCLADVWEALGNDLVQEINAIPGGARLTGGITRSPAWAGIVADVLGIPLTLVETADASAVGAAMLGQVALGIASSLDAVAQCIVPGETLQPDLARHRFYLQEHRRFQQRYQQLWEGAV